MAIEKTIRTIPSEYLGILVVIYAVVDLSAHHQSGAVLLVETQPEDLFVEWTVRKVDGFIHHCSAW